jgi:hypothetical protein
MNKENIIYKLDDAELLDYVRFVILKNTDLEEDDIIQSILAISLNPVDYDLADKLCTKFIESENYNIKNMSIMAVGHIARVYKKLVNEELYKKIQIMYLDQGNPFSGLASDTLDDIQIFLGIPKLRKQSTETDF